MKRNNRVQRWMGLGLMVVGIGLGLYLGLWLFFVGGIVSLVHMFVFHHWVMRTVAWDIAKIVLANVVGGLSAMVFVIPVWALLVS